MRVGIFLDTFYPMVDGVINVVDNYAKELSKKMEVVVFCPAINKTYIKDRPYKVVQCKSLAINWLEYDLPTPHVDRAFMKEIKKYKLDIVHIHSPFTMGMLGTQVAKSKKIPLVATIHSQFKQDFEKHLKIKPLSDIALLEIMKVFNACDECWTVNPAMAELYKSEYNLTAPCKIIYNATDFTPITDKEKAFTLVEQTFNIPKNQTLYLFVGRINYLKGVDLIAKSLKILKDQGQKFTMLFAGTGEDEDRLKELIGALNLNDCVIMAGRIDSKEMLASLYARAKLFLFPSLYDANSLVQIECASQKTPTLFVTGAKTASLIKKDENGFIAENSPQSYADEILRIEKDCELYNKVSQNAFESLYVTWEEIANTVYKNYLRLLIDARRKKLLKLYKKRNRRKKLLGKGK